MIFVALYGRIFHEIRVRAKSFAGTNDAVVHPDISHTRKPKKTITDNNHEGIEEKQNSTPAYNGFVLPENPTGVPQIVVETPDDGVPGKPKRRRIVEYDGITLIHLSDKYSSSENIAMEKFDDVDVSVEFDDDDEVPDMMLRLPSHTVDDDCVSLSDYDLEEDEPERVKPAKVKKLGKGPRFARLRKFSLTRRLSTSSRKLSMAFPKAAEKPLQEESCVTETLVATQTVSDPTTPSPSSRKRLLTMLTKPVKEAKPSIKIDQPNKFKREKKAAFQLGVILGAFCLCFLPYFIR